MKKLLAIRNQNFFGIDILFTIFILIQKSGDKAKNGGSSLSLHFDKRLGKHELNQDRQYFLIVLRLSLRRTFSEQLCHRSKRCMLYPVVRVRDSLLSKVENLLQILFEIICARFCDQSPKRIASLTVDPVGRLDAV